MADRLLLNQDQIRRAIVRIAHEIMEHSRGIDEVVLVGIHTRGVTLAQRLSYRIGEFENAKPAVGSLDVGLYRDDILGGAKPLMQATNIPVKIEGQLVVLVDDVLYTGRTIRAAMDALTDFGRPRQIQLATLIDRGHRELPIRADYIGKNAPSSEDDIVRVRLQEIDGTEEVVIARKIP